MVGSAIVAGGGDCAGEDWDRSAEMLMQTLAPHDGQRAVSVRSSTDRSELKSNELFAPHLQGMYFLRETIGITRKRNDAAINNAYSTVTDLARLRGLSGSFFIFTAM